jgi:diacylglycerol kinase (ATP)
MGILRAIFRISQQADGVGGEQSEVTEDDESPVYPPEDVLHFGFEEVFVTLALLAVSFIVLSTPCYSISRSARSGARLNAGCWTDVIKRCLRFRKLDDLRNAGDDRRNFDPQRWEKSVRSSNFHYDYDADKTIRATGSQSAFSTPLRSLFKSSIDDGPQHIHSSASDSHLKESPFQKGGILKEEKRRSFYDEDIRRETDHEKFEKAWQQIRFAEYRRLVLPPECKLVEFQTSQWRDIEQTLENLLDEPTWNKIFSHVRSFVCMLEKVIDGCHKYLESLLSRDSAHRFSTWMMGLFRYRLRKQRGMPVEEDYETDEDDDASVTITHTVQKQTKSPSPAKIFDTTPVVTNRIFLSESFTSGPISMPEPVNQEPIKADESIIVSQSDELASLRHRLHTTDINDDATFASALGLEQCDSGNIIDLSTSVDIPDSLEKSPRKLQNISPFPIKLFQQTQMDSVDNFVKHDAIATPLPTLKTSTKLMGRQSPKHSNRDSTDSSKLNFFDTATSDRQLRDMSRAVPIPDSNGYILGDEFLSSSSTPLLVFVNSRSGPQQGNLLITQFRRLLNPIQVWDLSNGGPEKVLKSFSVLSRFQILVCGGDGTVSWIISVLEKMTLKRWPPIGILPLGTGNDLSRIHGWGGGYNNESLLFVLRQISEAYISMLDLWELSIVSTSKKGHQRKEVKSFINYLGVGVDAQAALQVHNLRESSPKLFFSRFFNKAWYAMAGGEEAIKSSCSNLPQQITLLADGVEIPLPPDSQGIIFLNIDSYSGGVPLWSKGLKPQRKRRRYSDSDFSFANGNGLARNESIEDLAELKTSEESTACAAPSSCQDGLLDVVSIRGAFHLGQIRVGLSHAQLLCQCREAHVTLKKKVAIQIDGEPWRQNPSTLHILRKLDRANMLNRSAKDSGAWKVK